MQFTTFYFLAIGLPTLVVGQLSGSVGPLTDIASKKATKTCDVTDYGAVADKSTDLGPPLTSAWADCADGGVVVIPEGDYALDTWVSLTGGNAIAIQWDGIIYRTGTDGGNMIFVEHSSDVEIYSSTSGGAFQGLGYEFHADDNYEGPRILRLYDVSDFSVHDIALVDSPLFHFSMDTCENGEVYNMAIRGGDSGGLDGIDVWSTNIWIHDVTVTNKDECVTVKSPSKNILVENIYCNWSGGCAFGSLGSDTDISTVTYRNIYTWSSNQMLMIKSYGGSGTVSDVVLENFIGHGNAYSLDIDQYWSSMDPVDGDGVQLNNITIKNWKGTEADGAERGPVKILCADGAPCTEIVIEDFAMWTESGDSQWYACQSAYGSGFCLDESSDAVSYDVTTSTQTATPTGYSAATMADDLATAFGLTVSIPIPTIPTSFYPGATPYSALMGSGASVDSAVESLSASAADTPVSSAAGVASSTLAAIASSGVAASSGVFPASSFVASSGVAPSSGFAAPTGFSSAVPVSSIELAASAAVTPSAIISSAATTPAPSATTATRGFPKFPPFSFRGGRHPHWPGSFS